MYGNEIQTNYDRETGQPRSVVGSVETSHAGNVILRIGATCDGGWMQTEHVAMTPDEARRLAAEILAAEKAGRLFEAQS